MTLQKMIDTGELIKSPSPWAFPIVLAPKKYKTARFCVDARKLWKAKRKRRSSKRMIKLVFTGAAGLLTACGSRSRLQPRTVLVLLLHTALLSPRKQREAKKYEETIIKHLYNITIHTVDVTGADCSAGWSQRRQTGRALRTPAFINTRVNRETSHWRPT